MQKLQKFSTENFVKRRRVEKMELEMQNNQNELIKEEVTENISEVIAKWTEFCYETYFNLKEKNY